MLHLRSYRSPLLAVVLGSALLISQAPLMAQASTKKPTASSVLKALKASLAKESGVHITVNSKSGTTFNSVKADLGTKGGSETFISGKSNIKISVTPTYAYLSGNASGLTTLVGLTSTQQKLVGTKSIAMKAGTSPYTSFKSNLTTTAFAAFLPTSKGIALSRDKYNHYVLTWTTKATSTVQKSTSVLTISSGKKILPIKEVTSSKTGGGTTKFSKWGENPVGPTPSAASTISYSKVVKAVAG